MEDVERECAIHGVSKHFIRGPGKGYRCSKCSGDAVARRRRKLKQLAVDHLGGECSSCGYRKCIEALEFHHTDPSNKDFGISNSGATRSFEKIKLELAGCILLCANCHREEHYRLRNI